MLDNAFAHFPGQVEAGELGVAPLQFGDDAQGLFVVIKAAVLFHQAGQGDFTGVTEGRVPQVVRQADGFDQVLVGAQGAGDGAPNLGYFQGVGQAGAVVVAFIVDEYLGLVFQAAEGGGVQDAVAVALEGGAVFRLVIRVCAAAWCSCCAGRRAPAGGLQMRQVLLGCVT